jgi:hypothetical protein
MSKRFVLTIPNREKFWLEQLAASARKSEAEIVRLLIQIAAQRAGLPDPDKPPAPVEAVPSGAMN